VSTVDVALVVPVKFERVTEFEQYVALWVMVLAVMGTVLRGSLVCVMLVLFVGKRVVEFSLRANVCGWCLA